VKNGKPHPDIFLEACKIGGESVESALVLEGLSKIN
jgi:beta-phosphoglucomutase-like phosphatase (HAD superfamily)